MGRGGKKRKKEEKFEGEKKKKPSEKLGAGGGASGHGGAAGAARPLKPPRRPGCPQPAPPRPRHDGESGTGPRGALLPPPGLFPLRGGSPAGVWAALRRCGTGAAWAPGRGWGAVEVTGRPSAFPVWRGGEGFGVVLWLWGAFLGEPGLFGGRSGLLGPPGTPL